MLHGDMAAVVCDSASQLTPPPFGTSRHTRRCWEFGTVALGTDSDDDLEDPPEDPADFLASPSSSSSSRVTVLSAWFGDPEDALSRCDITRQAKELVAAGGQRAEVPATIALWGDPARFRVKRLEVNYERSWLTVEEREAMLPLARRASIKALDAPDLEELLTRLGVVFLSAAGPREAAADDTSDAAKDSDRHPALGSSSPRWKKLGFQSCNPRTDLRTGRLALEALVYLAERYPAAAQCMVVEAQGDGVDYPFAVASVNVTQLLARYLGIVNDGSLGPRGGGCQHIAPRKVVRRFSRLLLHPSSAQGSGADAFCELHAAAMARLHAIWCEMKRESPSITVMDFSAALDDMMDAVHSFCVRSAMSSPADFRGVAAAHDYMGVAALDANTPRRRPAAELIACGEYDTGLYKNDDTLMDSVGNHAQAVSEAASVVGTYLRGIIGGPLAGADIPGVNDVVAAG